MKQAGHWTGCALHDRSHLRGTRRRPARGLAAGLACQRSYGVEAARCHILMFTETRVLFVSAANVELGSTGEIVARMRRGDQLRASIPPDIGPAGCALSESHVQDGWLSLSSGAGRFRFTRETMPVQPWRSVPRSIPIASSDGDSSDQGGSSYRTCHQGERSRNTEREASSPEVGSRAIVEQEADSFVPSVALDPRSHDLGVVERE